MVQLLRVCVWPTEHLMSQWNNSSVCGNASCWASDISFAPLHKHWASSMTQQHHNCHIAITELMHVMGLTSVLLGSHQWPMVDG